MHTVSLSDLSIEELLQQVREKRKAAWEELLKRCQPDLKRWAERRLGESPPAGIALSDIIQEASLGAYERFPSFRGTSAGGNRSPKQLG